MGKGNLFTGIVAGVAMTLAGRYLLNNTEKGREVKKRVKEEVDKLRGEINNRMQKESDRSL